MSINDEIKNEFDKEYQKAAKKAGVRVGHGVVRVKRNRGLASRICWGLFFLAAAAAIILNQIGVFTFMELSLGTMILAVLLVIVIVFGLAHRYWVCVFFPLGFLSMIFQDTINLPNNLNWWLIFAAALLLTIGFHILFRSHKYESGYFSSSSGTDWSYRKGYWETKSDDVDDVDDDPNDPKLRGFKEHEKFETVYNSPDSSEVYASVHFGSAIKYVNAENFEHAVLDCSFGALKVYFDNASITSDEATIDLRCSFGAIELYVPSDWRLMNDINYSFSGLSEKNPRRANGTGPVVWLKGSASLSGIEVIYV